MYNHDYCHDQGEDVHEIVGRLEYEGICDLNRPRIAFRLYANAIIDVLMTD